MIDDQRPQIESDTPAPTTNSPPRSTNRQLPSSTGPVNGHPRTTGAGTPTSPTPPATRSWPRNLPRFFPVPHPNRSAQRLDIHRGISAVQADGRSSVGSALAVSSSASLTRSAWLPDDDGSIVAGGGDQGAAIGHRHHRYRLHWPGVERGFNRRGLLAGNRGTAGLEVVRSQFRSRVGGLGRQPRRTVKACGPRPIGVSMLS